jgi:methyltransferase
MIDFLPFLIVISIIVFQRIIELFIAKRNENWMKIQGAVEFGARHYKYLVVMHGSFFLSLTAEKVLLERGLSPLWPFIFCLFGLTQLIRVWVISSLGKFWNTKILVLANEKIVKKGPYRFVKHPNYFVVAMELVVVPLLFNAFYTALLFTILNALMMMVRIPEEEKALSTLTEYERTFQDANRFLPRFVK